MSPQTIPAAINGVEVYTRSGQLKARYTAKERLRILGATKADLDATIRLLCPNRPLFAATRRDSADPRAWTTPRGRLTDADVLRHLCGDLLPGIAPRWVAPRSWEITLWIGIDIDYRGDREDFLRRVQGVRRALGMLGIPPKAILSSRTPSGGRHLRFFLTRPIRVVDIPQVLENVGLRETPGKIELFPRLNKGMRLPFGHLPGIKHDPRRWLRFIRRYRRRKFPLVDWLECIRKSEKYGEDIFWGRADPIDILSQPSHPQQPERPQQAEPTTQPERTPQQKTRKMPGPILGISKRHRLPDTPGTSHEIRQYLELLSRPIANPAEGASLWSSGILQEGTRIEASKRVAWHLLFVRGLSVEDATKTLVRWVYNTGRNTSKDVRADLLTGKRTVERQTEKLVKWLATKHHSTHHHSRDKSRFSQPEIDAVRQRLGLRVQDWSVVAVALHFLRFAKLWGSPTEEGWSVQVAVNGVFRKWPGCRGMAYKPLIDALKECGLVRMTREKKQSADGTGRPRTYLVCVAPDLQAGAMFSLEEAVKAATEDGTRTPAAETRAPCNEPSPDTYRRSIPPSPRVTQGDPKEEVREQSTFSRPRMVSRREVLTMTDARRRFEQAEQQALSGKTKTMAFGHVVRLSYQELLGLVPGHRPRITEPILVRLPLGNRRRAHLRGRRRPEGYSSPPHPKPTASEEERNES